MAFFAQWQKNELILHFSDHNQHWWHKGQELDDKELSLMSEYHEFGQAALSIVAAGIALESFVIQRKAFNHVFFQSCCCPLPTGETVCL